MKNKLIIFFLLLNISSFSQIVRTLPNVNNTSDTLKPVSTPQKTAINQKLHTVSTIAALQAFTSSTVCQFDGSTWNLTSGNVASNGGSYAGTIINVSTSFYWERKILNGISAKWFGYDPKLQTGDCENSIKNAITASLYGGTASKQTDVILDEGVWNYAGTTGITVPSTVRIRGASKSKTAIYITSSVAITLFTFQTGTSINYDNSIDNLTIKSASATLVHTAIKLVDVSTCSVKDIVIGSDVNGGYFKGTGIDVNGRDQMSFVNLRIYADKPIVINPNPNNTISIDHTTFRDILLASPAVAGNKMIEIKSGVNLTNVNFEGYISFNGGQHGIYWLDNTSTQASLNFNIHNIRHEQEIAGGFMIYIAHNTNLKNLNLENIIGGLNAGFVYVRNVEKVSMLNCLHYGSTVSIDAIGNNLNYNISAINFYKSGTLNLSGYNLNKYGNDNYLWTYTDNNILSNNVSTNSNGIGVNGIPTASLPNVITTPLIGDKAVGLILGTSGTGTAYRENNVIFRDMVDANGTYTSAVASSRENFTYGWQGQLTFKLNKVNSPNYDITTLSNVMQFNGRLNTVFLLDKINSGFYTSATARTLTTPLGVLNFDATGAIGTQPIGQLESMTTTQINALVSPVSGKTVFNGTLLLPVFYNGTAWKRYDNTAM